MYFSTYFCMLQNHTLLAMERSLVCWSHLMYVVHLVSSVDVRDCSHLTDK